ncbi:MAG: DUF1801 domain-containing protein [Candidatus Thiodiazotropha sp. L084R]
MDEAVKEYLDTVPEIRKEKVDLLHSLILKCFPEATVDMKYKMPTYKYGEGWVAVANQKSYVSLYTCSAEHLKSSERLTQLLRQVRAASTFERMTKYRKRQYKRLSSMRCFTRRLSSPNITFKPFTDLTLTSSTPQHLRLASQFFTMCTA